MPLVGDNRTLVKIGLEQIKNSEFAGVRALYKAAGNGDFDTTKIGYYIAPKLNAPGRIDTADIACELLLATADYEAEELLGQIDALNEKRQTLEQKATEEAEVPENIVSGPENNIIILFNKDWHSGIVGLIAGRLMSKYNKPVIAFTQDIDANGNEILKGSGRSIDGVNIFELLTENQELLV